MKLFGISALVLLFTAFLMSAQPLYVDQYNPICPMVMESGLFQDAFEVVGVRFAPTGSMNHFKTDRHRLPSDHYRLGIH